MAFLPDLRRRCGSVDDGVVGHVWTSQDSGVGWPVGWRSWAGQVNGLAGSEGYRSGDQFDATVSPRSAWTVCIERLTLVTVIGDAAYSRTVPPSPWTVL